MREAISIVRLNETAALWGDAMWRACWQGALAALIVWVVCLSWKRMPSALRYALWWSACLKLVLALSPALIQWPGWRATKSVWHAKPLAMSTP
jgi:hypothetical protein